MNNNNNIINLFLSQFILVFIQLLGILRSQLFPSPLKKLTKSLYSIILIT